MSRWVRIAVSLFDGDHFPEEPFTEREAWIWIIAHAAWRETSHRIGNEVVPVAVGSFFTTLRLLQAEWKWKSTTKVRAFLKTLEKQHMVSFETNTGKTQIFVSNYKKYQDVNSAEAAQATQEKNKKNTPRAQGKHTKDTSTPEHQNTNNSSSSEEESALPPSEQAFQIFSEAVKGTRIPLPSKLTKDRTSKLKQRLDEHGLEGWITACSKLAASDFCRGSNDRGWIANFDFLLQPTSLNKLLEGQYDNRTATITAPKLTEFQRRREENLAFFSGKTGPGYGAGTDDFGKNIDLGPEDYGSPRPAATGF